MFTLAIVMLILSSAASSSRIGPTCLQGPHHSAQKSTKQTPLFSKIVF
jgi:hypothetical protein